MNDAELREPVPKVGRPSVTFFDPYAGVYAGAQRVIHELALELKRRGTNVEVLVPGPGALTDRLQATGIAWASIPIPKPLMIYGHATTGLRAWLALAALPKLWLRLLPEFRRRGGLTHVNDLRGILLVGVPSRLAGVPIAWHVNNPEPNRILNKIGGRIANLVVVPSNSALDSLEGVPRAQVRVVPNGVSNDLMSEPAAGGATPLVVTAARLVPEKGLETLVEALPRIIASVPEVHCVIQGAVQTGYEQYEKALRRKVSNLCLEGHVTFQGSVDRPWNTWCKASVYVQPSHREPFGLAVVEAMALGLPVVASAVGGMKENVVDGVTGYLVPAGDPEALGNAVIGLLTDRTNARRMGESGRARALEAFTMPAVVDAMERVYAELTS